MLHIWFFFLYFSSWFTFLKLPFGWSRPKYILLNEVDIVKNQKKFTRAFFFSFDTDRSILLFRAQMETSSTACISPTSQLLIILSSRTTQYRWANQLWNFFRNRNKRLLMVYLSNHHFNSPHNLYSFSLGQRTTLKVYTMMPRAA